MKQTDVAGPGIDGGDGMGRATQDGHTALEDLLALEEAVHVCQMCELAQTRKKAVPGDGNRQALVLFGV